MARTPLLRAIERLAEEHRTAGKLGIEPDELRGRRREAAYTRGDFLKRAGTAGAALAVAGPAAFARPSRAGRHNQQRIAIVGGGIAGLCAALTLADAGVSSTVYEANTAGIGGRMHSDRSGYWSNHQISEFCGELIDSGHETILDLADRFGLAVDDLTAAQPAGTDDTYYFLGDFYPTSQADKDFKPVNKVLQKLANAADYPTTWDNSTPTGRMLDHMSVYDWIETYVPGGHHSAFGRLLDAAYAEEYGANTSDQASLNLVYLLAFQPDDAHGHLSIFGESDERYHIRGGNQQLPEAIAASLPSGTVKQGWTMQSIRTNRDGSVSMQFSTPGRNQTVTADQVILCMSFAVLRTLDYSGAGFDQRKQTAITQLGAGRNAKLQLQFQNRLWNAQGSTGSAYTDLGIQNTWDVTRAQPGSTGILVDYSGGDIAGGYAPSTPYSNAGSNPQVTAYAKQFLAKLETVYPGITNRWNGKATLSTPFRDPLLNCSYSYWRVGQYTQFSGYEGVPQGSIHFAGEHCSQDFQGYMEGGASEGVRAANEILGVS